LVLLADVLEGNSGGVLLANKLTESCLSLNEAEWNVHLSAELWEPDDQLNWVDIVGNDNKSSLLLLNEGGDVVKTELKNARFLGVFSLLASCLSFSSSS